MPTYRHLICEFPQDDRSYYDASKFVVELTEFLHSDPNVGPDNTFRWKINDTPITMGRNRALATAEKNRIDYVWLVDSDQAPDMYVGNPLHPDAKRFAPTAWKFALDFGKPCALVAPYCGKPPHENVFVFRWTDFQSDCPDKRNFTIEQYSRFEAATRKGIEQVAAGPTGCCLIDMRGVKWLKHPRFYYEWKDETHTEKASTEDVVFFRDLNWAGCPVFCLWDCWAGHWKPKLVGKPEYCDPTDIQTRIAESYIYEAAKRLKMSEKDVLEQLKYMYRRPDEVEKL